MRWLFLLPLLAAGCAWDWDRFVPPERCSWHDPDRFTLSPPTPLTGINTSGAKESKPFLSADGLTLYFTSDRGDGKFRSYLARRGRPDGPFETVEEQSGINLPGGNGVSRFTLSGDGLTAYIAAPRGYPKDATGDAQMFSATRKSPGEPFARAGFAPLTGLNTPENEWDPFISPDGLRLYYAEHTPSRSEIHLMVSERSVPGDPWVHTISVPGLALSDLEPPKTDADNPAVTADERLIVFSSDLEGSAGSRDLWYAVRSERSGPFSAPRPLPAVNTAAWESDTFVTPDGCRVYFTRVDDLYTSRYLPR